MGESKPSSAGDSAPRLSVVIPARDAAPTLGRTLDALRAQEIEERFEVIVVDDGSRDGTTAIARAHEPFVRLLEGGAGHGPGAARNRGAAVARGSILAFTDSDCFPTPHWLAHGLEALERADIVQGAVAPDPAAKRAPFDRTLEVDSERGFYQTANLLLRRELFERVGGFHDWVLEKAAGREWAEDRRRGRATRTPIGEDTLFAWRARRLGLRTTFAPAALVHHVVVPGGVRDEMADRWHWGRDMPGLAREVPELRDGCFYRRLFFHARTARFDLAAASVALAALTRSPLPLAGALPYAAFLRREARRFSGRERTAFTLGSVALDAATCAALVAGSIEWRSPVL